MPVLAGREIDIELSSHVTDPARQDEQTKDFEAVLRTLRAAGVSVVAPLDALAASARTSVHELVVGLGTAYRLRVVVGDDGIEPPTITV